MKLYQWKNLYHTKSKLTNSMCYFANVVPATQSFDFPIQDWGEMVMLLMMKILQHPDGFQDVFLGDSLDVSLRDQRVKLPTEFT